MAALPTINLSEPHTFIKPAKRIHDSHDVAFFLRSVAYRDIGTFILQLNHAICPRILPGSLTSQTFPLTTSSTPTASILALQALLSEIGALTTEVPPDIGPRRFGNVSFRKWYALLEDRIASLVSQGRLGALLQDGSGPAGAEVLTYLLGAFGSAQRLDYGTGHELSFVAFLGCLWKLGFFLDGIQGGDIEREIVLFVIEPYLRVVRNIITTYTLEPAGSHGVWGLDDHSFIPYIFGSAQLTKPINDCDPIPTTGSVKGSPKPSDVTNSNTVEIHRQSNMYFSAIGFINDVKKGPFWEHSPILFDISGIRDGWGKINKGMIKMYNAEVLSKFPVIQHFPFGSLFSWENDIDTSEQMPSPHVASMPATSKVTSSQQATVVVAPWAQNIRMPRSTASQSPSMGSDRMKDADDKGTS